jgi:hypothetical protein
MAKRDLACLLGLHKLPVHLAQSDQTRDAVSVTATLRAPEFEK